MCHFNVHIPHVEKRKFSPQIRTWKLRDPATARQFQLAFELKVTSDMAATGTADTANCVQEPPVETWNLVVEWTGGWSNARKVGKVHSLQSPEEGRQDGWGPGGRDRLQWHQVHNKAHHLADKVWGREREFATVPLDVASVLCSSKQLDHTNQDVVGENCECNDAGGLALTDEANMLSLIGQEMSSLGSPQLSSQCVCDPGPQSTHKDEILLKGCWPFWPRCWKLLVRKWLSW